LGDPKLLQRLGQRQIDRSPEAEEGPGVYTVRLGFMAPSGDRRGWRVFDIELQGSTVLEDFDILAAAGSPHTAVIKEFNGIRVRDALTLKLVSNSPDPDMQQAPLVNFIEIIRERVVD